MSTSLYWSKLPTEPKEESLYDLKWILAEKLWGSDGSTGEGAVIVGVELIPFLEGIVAGGNGNDVSKAAKKLIAAIEKHEKVQLCIHS